MSTSDMRGKHRKSMTDTERTFNMVLAFLGKHGLRTGGLGLLGEIVLRSGEKFDIIWSSLDGEVDQLCVFHGGHCVFNSKFDGRLHVYPPREAAEAWAETVVADKLLPALSLELKLSPNPGEPR